MKSSYLTLLTGSVLLSSILTGCGGTVQGYDTADNLQPHQINMRTTTGSVQENNDYADIWHEYISITSGYTINDNNTDSFSLNVTYAKGISTDVAHFQIYLDTDNNKATGFSLVEGDDVISGADYLIEDGILFKSKSNSTWEWSYVDEFNYQAQQSAQSAYNISASSSSPLITDIINEETTKSINISVRPTTAKWTSTYNFVSARNVAIEISGEKEVIVPEPVVPEPVVPEPVVPEPVVPEPVVPEPVVPEPVAPEPVVPEVPVSTETVYEDAENGLSNGWTTILGEFQPQRKTPGYKNESQAFVKLQNNWTQNDQGRWNNSAEYHLELGNTNQTILSIDLVGDGLVMEHYVLGVKVSTNQGERTILWDSYYNHLNIPASQRTLSDGSRYMVFPAPVEMVRGYGYADVTLSENFSVDLEAALKYFEPTNNILSVDTLVATGGNLDNIKLLSN